MKKFFVIASLILAVTASLIAGTLASYNVTLDNLASGSVVAKEFIFMKDGADTFGHGVKIAPTETVIWNFAVRNFDGVNITETDLYYKLTFDVGSVEGKNAIDPLIVTIKASDGTVLKTHEGTGTIKIIDSFMLSNTGQRDEYIVEIYWPSNPDIDIDYAGHKFGTKIDVSAVASQFPFDDEDEEPVVDPEDPDDDENVESDIAVHYKQNNMSWQGGSNGHFSGTFAMTITNNSDQPIVGWQLKFVLPGEILYPWSAIQLSYVATSDEYIFTNPADHNKAIPPGGSITFGATLKGNEAVIPISAVTVNGQPVVLTTEH